MTRDDIIRMAREAGAYPAANTDGALLFWSESQVERFAALILAAEREACAKVCDEMEASGALSSLEKYRTRFIADAIRARSQS